MLARAAGVGIGLASVREEIIACTGLHPFLLELLCNRIVDIHQETGELDVKAAYEYEAPTFYTQFAQLRQNIEADSEGRATALLRRLAVGAAAEPVSLENQPTEADGCGAVVNGVSRSVFPGVRPLHPDVCDGPVVTS